MVWGKSLTLSLIKLTGGLQSLKEVLQSSEKIWGVNVTDLPSSKDSFKESTQ